MRLLSDNIKIYDSIDHKDWYKIQSLIDKYPDCHMYCVPTTLKGIGKSYSVWHQRLIKYANQGWGAVIINWERKELDAMIDELQNNASELTDYLTFEVEWHKNKGVTVCRNKETGIGVFYFVTPSDFSVMKGMTIKGNLPIYHVFWDEFLLPQGIYRKPKETLDAFWQLIGSIFRENDVCILMCANNTNPNNPFLWYFFKDMGWPEYGQTIVNHDAGIVIDSPKYNQFMANKYKKSNLWKLSKVNPQIHAQLFGGGKLNDSLYDNQDKIINRLPYDVKFQFNFKIGIDVYNVYTYFDEEYQIWLAYITPARHPKIKDVFYSGDITTFLETSIQIIPEDKVLSIKGYIEENKLRFRDVRTMNIINDWVLNYRDIDKPIDWTKKEN